MSKMRMPEMSVVRFTESDVIVASLYLSKSADGQAHNLTLTRNGVEIYKNGTTDYRNNISLYYGGSGSEADYYFIFDTSYSEGRHSLFSMADLDSSGSDVPNSMDGEYVWNGNNTFTLIRRQ